MNPNGREKWGPGPWDKEPDEIAFISEEGYHCLVLRNALLGHLCGYVGISESHPLFGKEYDDEDFPDLDVHGGITFSGELKQEPSLWWFGFDCAHAFDLMPSMMARLNAAPRIFCERHVYRDMAYVHEECKSLASQLGKLQTS